ncbi:AlkZ-related protein [Paenibacillus apiarius]|uniref:Uncharacterized protein n=1 Tax=Paenibacillus apiarius TaxID=46240 RepID=A0ABT4DT71_9BACL|nr:hypothetical protein [Paenibacillus apiarius]MCY9515005.1 hypothetical protein [Paenibacillus apiarius]MCY9520555.1 hypothetical protein [Paenibacillus apiarius]MCY9552138.1 hypothetical protein [Paenibacillus apiarius]MCY9561075.1 hypothetical protein [Paenibacillus apiarius]MCY9686284.1 hypothetical protein [Paenibacillus apiarius]
MKQYSAHTYEEAVLVIQEVGILPLAKLIPDHPSLGGITKAEQWHSDTEFDPWRWRVRFPGDGTAAYGKFLKKKAIFIARDLVPLVYAILGSPRSGQARYEDGLLSKPACELLAIIEAQQGIETRSLRAAAGMKAVEKKKEFDQAVIELQGTMDIAISGVKARRNEAGEINGWNSTSYETMPHWMEHTGIEAAAIPIEDVRERLHERLSQSSSAEAMAYMGKIFGW